MTNIIFVLGGPGSGKSTQCKKLVDKFGFVHISAGDVLRNERDTKSEDSELIKECIQLGKIVPGDITTKLLIKECLKHDNTVLIDGFPRNDDNYNTWYKMAPENLKVNCMVLFECDDDIMVNRILKRSSESMSKRVDDNMETVLNRINVFKDQTIPITEKFDNDNKLIRIDCSGSVNEIFENIKKALNFS